jgi:vibriolysin
VNYCNAFWNSTQMVYGDGNGSSCLPLARSIDVTAHELTHAVTERESGLIYSGESGGLNESMSDIFGNSAEAFADGGGTGPLQVSADTWKVGEDILPPALRYMNDPAADGSSLDYWTSGAGNVDVHYSSGISNLAFYLMSQGGTHPRGKSTIQVQGIGIENAVRVFYAINTDYLTSSSNFLAARNASLTAATALGFTQAQKDSVQNAWACVGVGAGTGGGGGGGGDDVPLTNNVPVTGISGATGDLKYYKLDVPSGASGLKFVISGGTGDADMYVKFGSRPTTSSYDCRPYLNGNSETCNIATAQVGTYYVMLRGYAAYSGVSLTGSYSTGGGGGDGVTVLVDGVPVTGISGATGSNKYWKINTPAGARLTVSISGGTGDADLYTRFGAKPTTSTYLCRPYLYGNNETCTVSSTSAGDYYVMLRGYSSYSGVTLRGDY